MKTVEILTEDQIRIGRRAYRLTRFAPPLPNHSVLSVEAAADPQSGYQDRFRLDDMRDVFAKDFPPDFSISVYEPKVGYNAINYLVLKNTGATPESLTSLQYYYQDWTHPANLHHFYKKLGDRLTKALPDCLRIETSADEVSVSLWATCKISESEDLFKHISRVARVMESELRSLSIDDQSRSAELGEPRQKAAATELKPDESGYKWWLRYILIPLGVAATGALIISLLK